MIPTDEIVELVLTQADELDALTASLDLHKAELRASASPFFFAATTGAAESLRPSNAAPPMAGG